MNLFAPRAYDLNVQKTGWVHAAAESLRHNGFCVLRGSPIQRDLCTRCASAAGERLDLLLPLVQAHNLDVHKDTVMFKELCKRMHHLRFDIRLPVPNQETLPGSSALPAADEAAWSALHAEAHQQAFVVLKEVLGCSEDCTQLDACIDTAGCVVSLPGSAAQKYHQDGSLEGFFNVFVPLVDVTAQNGPTQFQPGSQIPVREDLAFAAPVQEPVAPYLAAGELLIFDYRVQHRGLANMSDTVRPVAYLVYARRGFSDVHNFPADKSLFDPYQSSELSPPETDHVSEQIEPHILKSGSNTAKADARKHASQEAQLLNGRVASNSWWHDLRFKNTAQELLGVDGCCDDVEYREVRGACFAAAKPTPLLSPHIVCVSRRALALLGASDEFHVSAAQLCGNELPSGASPAAHCYCGFQYGTFAGQLGDGAALSLGELVVSSESLVELNLKGTGINPLTRWWYTGLNGRKNVTTMVREFLMAEALFALGVPTTRGVAVIGGQDSSDQKNACCAVLLRAADTFIRFGSFEVTLPYGNGHHAPSAFDWHLLRKIADYCIESYYSFVLEVPDDLDEEDDDLRASPRYYEFVLEVTRRTARLVASWQCLGAVHGMLNTDNLSIVGITLDHGSFAFSDHFSASFAGRAKEPGGRYSFENQPAAIRWGCERFAEALLPLHCTPIPDICSKVTETFNHEYEKAYNQGMCKKIGLTECPSDLVCDLLAVMEKTDADWTCTFRGLTEARSEAQALAAICRWCKLGSESDWKGWLSRYTELLLAQAKSWEDVGRTQDMEAVNPIVVPREYILKKAEKAAELGNYDEVMQVLKLLTQPYAAPSCMADAWPAGMPTLDPKLIGPKGDQVVQALEDADCWRNICPELCFETLESTQACLREFTITEKQCKILRTAFQRDGVFTLTPKDLPWAVDLTKLATSVERLVSSGWPPAFLWVYDEPWIMLAQMSPLLKKITGADVCFDIMVSNALPGESSIPFCRERPLAGFKQGNNAGAGVGFFSDGTPAFAKCWIALGDMPPTSSCLMCIPRAHDPGYMDSANLHWGPEMLHHVRPLNLDMGGSCTMSHRLFHWGKVGDAIDVDGNAAPRCISLSLAVADEKFETPCLPRRLLPLPPLQLRVALAAGQTLLHDAAGKYSREKMDLLWNCFLACSEHFDPSFCNRVLRASPLG